MKIAENVNITNVQRIKKDLVFEKFALGFLSVFTFEPKFKREERLDKLKEIGRNLVDQLGIGCIIRYRKENNFLTYFYIKDLDPIVVTGYEKIRKIDKVKGLVDWDIVDKFHLGERFLSKGSLIRIKLKAFSCDGFYVCHNNKREEILSKLGSPYVEVYLTLSTDFNAGSILIVFKFSNVEATTDDIIQLEHLLCQENFAISVCDIKELQGFKHIRGIFGVHPIFEFYLSKIRELLHPQIDISNYTDNVKALEIMKIRNFSIDKNQKLLDEKYYKAQIYGLITSDEGWRVVPTDEIERQLTNSWHSRSYFYFFMHPSGILVIDLAKEIEDETNRANLELPDLSKRFKSTLLHEYKALYSEIPCLSHGFIQLLEIVLMDKSLMNRLYDKTREIPKSLKDINELNDEVYETIQICKESIRIPVIRATAFHLMADIFGLTDTEEVVIRKMDEISRSYINMTMSRLTVQLNTRIILLTYLMIVLMMVTILLNYDKLLEFLSFLRGLFTRGIYAGYVLIIVLFKF